MLYERSALASIAHVVGQCLSEDHGIDPTPLFADSGIDVQHSFRPGERIKLFRLDRLFELAARASGDPLIGLSVGKRVTPGHYYAFGHSWIASESLLDAMNRLCRYDKIIADTGAVVRLEKSDDNYMIIETYPNKYSMPIPELVDFGISAALHLAQVCVGKRIRPVSVGILRQDKALLPAYRSALGTEVRTGMNEVTVAISASDMELPFLGGIPEVAKATDRIAEQYLQTLDTSKTAAKVRELLVDFLPSGNAHLGRVAHSLHRSASTLQRQLQAEGTTYRKVLKISRGVSGVFADLSGVAQSLQCEGHYWQ